MLLKPNEHLSRQLKYAHLEKVGNVALQQCGVFDSKLSFISDTCNVIFRSDIANHSYCVRVYQEPIKSIPEIHGELYWLLDLGQSTDLLVPKPVRNKFGDVVQEISVPNNEKQFQVVIFHWMPGDIIGLNIDTQIAKQLGILMAKLHTHAGNFDLPKDSFRENSDWQGMGHFRVGLSPVEISRIESLLEKDQLVLCDEVAKRAASGINQISTQYNFGLIHSDLHANNCLLHDGKIGIIDFDDCQFAPFSCDIAITICSFDDFSNQEALHGAFLEGYSENRKLSQNSIKEIEYFAAERRLRLIRWISTWPNVDYFPFGRKIINTSLLYLKKYLES
jgi:Ser/Thr protein kinase RdoA (MazF antagonist)